MMILSERHEQPRQLALPDRAALLDALNHAVRQAAAEGRTSALVLVDITNFAELNAEWGIPAGDAVLSAINDRLRTFTAERLDMLCADKAVAGRLDADHFALVVHGIANWSAIKDVGVALVGYLSQPYRSEGLAIPLRVRAGIVRLPDHAPSVASAIGRGFRVLNSTARFRPDGVAIAEEETAPANDLSALQDDLATAIRSDQLFIALQPKVDAKTGVLCGAEALVRWQHPERGLLAPAMFIEMAEKTGLVFDLGLRVLRDTCRAAVLLDTEKRQMALSVNVSAHQLSHPDFLARFLEVIDQEGVAPSSIEVELTETAAMMGGETITNSLLALRRCGIGIAIDDFGTGFSNLVALSALHADTLKIDRSLVAHDEQDERAAALLGITVQLAHAFSMSTVAEGVETSEQLERARQVGCDYVQGYLTGKPVSVLDFAEIYSK